MDNDKAFNSLDHNFLISALEKYGFGKSFISWVKLLPRNKSRLFFTLFTMDLFGFVDGWGRGVWGGGLGRSKMPLFLGTVKWLQFGAMGVGHLDTNNRVETMIDKTQLYHWMLHKLVGFST